MIAKLEIVVPDDYAAFLREHHGAEGFIGDGYFIFWKAEELVPFNREYEVEKYAPGLFLLGSDGKGEAYGFDTRDAAMPIVRVPFDGAAACGGSGHEFRRPDAAAQSRGDVGIAGRAGRSRPEAMELFEIAFVIVGGDPHDPRNKAWLTRPQHIEAVRFWNRIVGDLRNHTGR